MRDAYRDRWGVAIYAPRMIYVRANGYWTEGHEHGRYVEPGPWLLLPSDAHLDYHFPADEYPGGYERCSVAEWREHCGPQDERDER